MGVIQSESSTAYLLMGVLGPTTTEARMENPMQCTCKDTLSILWTLILCSAMNVLQHLEAIWALGSVPKPTGKKNNKKKTQQKN